MTTGVIWLLSLGVCAIAGAPLLHHAEYRRFVFLGRCLLAAAAGAVSLSWTMTFFALLGVRWNAVGVAAVGTAVCLGLRVLLPSGGREVPPQRSGSRLGSVGLAAIACGAAVVIIAFLSTWAGQTTSPDLLYFWGPKAQRFAEARTIDPTFLGNPLLDYLHSDYPPLLTNLYAFATIAAGSFSWWASIVLFPVLLGATGIVVASILASEYSRDWASLHAGLMTCALGVVGIQAMISGVAEMPLLFFEMVAVALLILERRLTNGILLLAGLCLAGAAGTKVEGLPFALAVALLFVVTLPAGARRARPLSFLLAPTAITLIPWFLFGAENGLFRFYRGYGSLFEIRWGNVSAVAAEMLRSIAEVGYGLPFLLPFLVFLAAPAKTRAVRLPIVTAVALICFLLATYLSAREDPRQLISWSTARVLSPVAGLLVLAASTSRTLRRLA